MLSIVAIGSAHMPSRSFGKSGYRSLRPERFCGMNIATFFASLIARTLKPVKGPSN